VARIAKNSPLFVDSRIPFPSQAPLAITAGATVNVATITYTPGQVSGTLSAADMANVPLQLTSLYFSANDKTNTFPEPCGGSIEFCQFNSVFRTGVNPPPGGALWQLFLKPGAVYQFLSQSFTLAEGPQAQSVVSWNYGQHIGTVNADQNLGQNHPLAQVASVTGNVSLGQPLYNIQVDIAGTTTTIDPVQLQPLSFSDSFNTTNYNSATPLAFSNYVGRIFNFADFTKPFTLKPQFTLSPDGQTILSYPPQVFSLAPGQQKTLDFSGTAATIQGKVVFDPPYPAGNIYPGIQAEASAPTGYGMAQTTLATNPQGGDYHLTVFGATWDYWRFGWKFDMGDPKFNSYYNVNQFLNILVPVAPGGTTQKDFQFDTALLKTYFSPPAGSTISAPQLTAISGVIVNGVFQADGMEGGTADSPTQNFVATGEVRMVLRVRPNGAFKITPSAVINPGPGNAGSSRTDFSPFILTPQKGDITVVGVPGSLSLTVTGPLDGQILTSCTIPVTGYATGTANISITVNGQAVTTTPAATPADPYRVAFSTTVPGQGANTPIMVVASSQTNAPVTAVLHVNAGNTAPPLVSVQMATSMMWPPDHDLINVGLAASADSSCGVQNPVVAVKVYSNESDQMETGSGNFSPDAKLAAGALRLRAERQGGGGGRVYLIAGTAGSGADCAAVVVPQDQSQASVAAIQAKAAAAVAACKVAGAAPSGYVEVGTGPVVGPKQ
jgi:hypothetical protein